MSAIPILYLLNIFILLMIAMLTQTVPTLKDHSTVRVIRDTLGMESRVLVILLNIFAQCCSFEMLFVLSLKHYYLTYTDINECDPSGLSPDYQHLAHQCHGDANCTNTKGSYNCGCQEGYYGNGRKCEGNKHL